jgi:hypothetical protein
MQNIIYKLASRDNIDSDKFDQWPAVLDPTFVRFDNRIEPHTFLSENDIVSWLDGNNRSKMSERLTNIQQFKNGDPNRVYSVYRCDHRDPNHDNMEDLRDEFLYNLRIKRSNDAYTTYVNEKGSRINSLFKKVDHTIEFYNNDIGIDYSADMRSINNEYFEGLYPLDVDERDKIQARYMEFVMTVHNTDTEMNKAKDYAIVLAKGPHATKWLDKFVKKLETVETYLEFFSKGGDVLVNIEKDDDHDSMIRYISKLLFNHRRNTQEDDIIQQKIRNMVIDPYLSSSDIYQIRYDRTLLTWHKNYSHVIKKTGLIPSKRFSDMIMNFSLADFFKQIHSKENLEAIVKNSEDIYGIKKRVSNDNNEIRAGDRSYKKETEKFIKIIKPFQNKIITKNTSGGGMV